VYSLSFVIPVLNEAARIPALLADLRARFPGAETIIVDGGSRDNSAALAIPLADSVLLGATGRAAQMNLGAATARGDVICFLHADSGPEFDEQDLLRALGNRPGWAYCRVSLRGVSRALRSISWFINWRARWSRVVTGDQMLIIERALFEQAGGFAEIPLMEDVEICRRLGRIRSPMALPLTVYSSGRRWDEQGVVTTVLRMWALRLAFRAGVSPQRLWNHYYGEAALSSGVRGRAGEPDSAADQPRE
jgi:rSAM/selenodomain-associated transferase 2